MMQARSIALSTKPGARLHYSTCSPASTEHGPLSATLLVFLNGLVLPRSSWAAAVDSLISTRSRHLRPLPHILTYDRYGQGDSDPDPTDADPASPYGHDACAVVRDLHQLLIQVCETDLHTTLDRTTLIFVCNSIGCPIARLYAVDHPRCVAAYIFLDSMMANTDFVSLFPDPDTVDFDPSTLPQGIDVNGLRVARERYRAMFHPNVPNAEHLDRRNLADLLPSAGTPLLPPGPEGGDPYLIVVGHDPEVFAEQSETGSLKVPKALTNAYISPAWQTYNKGLTKLLESADHVKGPVIVKKCGHFIQKDDPEYVAREVGALLDTLFSDKGVPGFP